MAMRRPRRTESARRGGAMISCAAENSIERSATWLRRPRAAGGALGTLGGGSGRFFLLLAAAQAGVAGGGELVLELLDSPGRVDELQFARVKRMTLVADVDLELLARAAGGELVAAAAGDLGLE